MNVLYSIFMTIKVILYAKSIVQIRYLYILISMN